MSPLESAEILAGTLVLLALCALAFIFIRRRILASVSHLMLCGLRHPAAKQYRLGLLRINGGQLEWFTLIGPRMRPHRCWDRARLELESPGPAYEVIAGLPDAVEVTCHYDGDSFRLALAPAAYTAMRSWLESAPPGHNVNVA
jgi:Protein of unknown function (DUF2550)